MVVVKIELWPLGDHKTAREIGRIFIANDATGGQETGNYNVKLMKSKEYSPTPGVWRQGRVEGFPRLVLGPYELVLRALKACLG